MLIFQIHTLELRIQNQQSFPPPIMLTRSLSKLMLTSPRTTKSVAKDSILLPNPLLLLPDEILAHIISFLSLSDIGMLCLTGSSLLRERVVAWISTNSCCKKVTSSLSKECMEHEEGFAEWVAVCKEFGTLCKRVSMLSSTSKRLKILSSWFSKLECLVCRQMNNDWAS